MDKLDILISIERASGLLRLYKEAAERLDNDSDINPDTHPVFSRINKQLRPHFQILMYPPGEACEYCDGTGKKK
jgi:hypothetical protein